MFDYSDVYIIPQYSEVKSRQDVNISSILDKEFGTPVIDIPIISANMDTISDGNFCELMRKNGGIGCLHRFMSIEKNIEEFKKVKFGEVIVSVGVGDKELKRAKSLWEAGARYFCIDIAHGHSLIMKDMIDSLRDEFGLDIIIIAGNTATRSGALNLLSWGADGVKIGIGPGAACSTKNVTGVTVPQFKALMQLDISDIKKNHFPNSLFIADGGIREIGDIAKALGTGCDFVMCGGLFAKCKEKPMPGVYRGSASVDVMRKIDKKNTTAEGKTIKVESNISLSDLMQDIAGGLRSAFSYSNSYSLEEFQQRCKFGYRI